MDAVALRYSTDTQFQPYDGAPTREAGWLEVTVATSALTIDDGKRIELYDFDRRRRHLLEHGDRTARDTSLFAYVQERASGLASAMHVLNVLQAGGAAVDSTTWQAEACYGLSSTPGNEPPLTIEQEETPEGRVWRIEGLEVARLTPRAEHAPLPPNGLRRLLVHAVRVHPAVVVDLVGAGDLPERLRTDNHFALSHQVQTLALQQVESVQLDVEVLCASYAPSAPADETLARIHDVNPWRSTRRLQGARDALSNGRLLEAMLAVVANSFATLDRSPELVREILDRAGWLAPVKKLQALAEPAGNARQARKQIAKLERLRPDAGAYGHVLDVLIGEKHTQLQETEPARAAFSRALETDPGLAATWISLGRAHMSTLRFADAWDCFELALSLCADHPVVSDIAHAREGLLGQHPELF